MNLLHDAKRKPLWQRVTNTRCHNSRADRYAVRLKRHIECKSESIVPFDDSLCACVAHGGIYDALWMRCEHDTRACRKYLVNASHKNSAGNDHWRADDDATPCATVDRHPIALPERIRCDHLCGNQGELLPREKLELIP